MKCEKNWRQTEKKKGRKTSQCFRKAGLRDTHMKSLAHIVPAAFGARHTGGSPSALHQTYTTCTVTNAANSASSLPISSNVPPLHHLESSTSSPLLSYASITTRLIVLCINSPLFVYLNVCGVNHPFHFVSNHTSWTLAMDLVLEKWQEAGWRLLWEEI